MPTKTYIPPKIHTYTGKMVDVTNLRKRDIDIQDIAHALSNQCRFSGHTNKFYSVAQHSVLVSRLVPEDQRLGGLLHDAPEAYLQDMARPLKMHPRLGQAYRGMESRVQKVMEDYFKTALLTEEIIAADNVVLVTEARDLMHGVKGWGYYTDIEPLKATIIPWSPARAKSEFMLTYLRLTV
jgi:5'-deoxynucleotidase YfbR-like HD superfamily hydrolase